MRARDFTKCLLPNPYSLTDLTSKRCVNNLHFIYKLNDIYFVFKFCSEVMYPTNHDFIYFRFLRFFLNISYQHFYGSIENPRKLFVYLNTCYRTVECFYSIGLHVDADGPALSRHSVLPLPDHGVPIPIKSGSY